MSIGRICLGEVDVAELGETVRTAAQRMQQRNVGSLVVVAEGMTPIGIVTDRDLVLRVLAEGVDPDTTRVEDVMTPEPRTVTRSTSIEEALAMMRRGEFRRLVVVDEEFYLRGVVALDDILKELATQFHAISSLLQRESPRSLGEE